MPLRTTAPRSEEARACPRRLCSAMQRKAFQNLVDEPALGGETESDEIERIAGNRGDRRAVVDIVVCAEERLRIDRGRNPAVERAPPRAGQAVGIGCEDEHRRADQGRVMNPVGVAVGLAGQRRIPPDQPARKEAGDVQLLPGLEILTHDNGDFRILWHACPEAQNGGERARMAHGEEAGLERLCGDHLRLVAGPHGLALLAARFAGHAYDRHRHETYAIGITLSGVQQFSYRGALRTSLPGRVIVIAPDEPHDGHAGSEAGFAYRMLYLDPRRIAVALDGYGGRVRSLPGGGAAVDEDRALAEAIGEAFARFPETPDAFATDGLIQAVADALLRRERARPRRTRQPINVRALEQARALMEEEDRLTAVGLESATGLDRFTLARQFRARFGTSPHRYWMGCRQRRARSLIQAGAALAAAALEAGFADQPHMTREFKASLGMAPGRFRKLIEAGRGDSAGHKPRRRSG